MREALGTWRWYALWALLFLNVTVIVAARLVGIISIANGAGRFLWVQRSVPYSARMRSV
jgi:hypothetical protein